MNYRVTARVRFLLLLAYLSVLAAVAVGWMVLHMRSTIRDAMAGSQAALRVMEAATSVEQDLLNARIHLIYYVTRQKPGSYDAGWERFRSATRRLPEIPELLRAMPGGESLEGDYGRLAHAEAAYEPVLREIVEMVQRGETSGPRYDELITRWAALGAAMVESAGILRIKASQAVMAMNRSVEATLWNDVLWLASLGALFGIAGWLLIGLLARRRKARANPDEKSAPRAAIRPMRPLSRPGRRVVKMHRLPLAS